MKPFPVAVCVMTDDSLYSAHSTRYALFHLNLIWTINLPMWYVLIFPLACHVCLPKNNLWSSQFFYAWYGQNVDLTCWGGLSRAPLDMPSSSSSSWHITALRLNASLTTFWPVSCLLIFCLLQYGADEMFKRAASRWTSIFTCFYWFIFTGNNS